MKMTENLDGDAVLDLAESTSKEVLRTSYKISRGIVGSSLKRPRSLLEMPVFALPRFLLEVILIRLVGRCSEGEDVVRTEKKVALEAPFRGVRIADTASWLADVVEEAHTMAMV